MRIASLQGSDNGFIHYFTLLTRNYGLKSPLAGTIPSSNDDHSGAGEETAFTPIKLLEEPAGLPENPAVGNVARTYARMANDLRDDTRTAPSFDDAVAIHRVLAAIERSAEDGDHVVLQD